MKPVAAFLGLSVQFLAVSAWAQDPNLSSGGLAPPDAIQSENQPTDQDKTEADLEKADKEDSGRGLEFFWLNAEIGVEHVGLQTLHANDLVNAEAVDTTQTGLVYGGGLGVRLIFLTLGARFRMGNFSAWQLWTLDAELGLRLPLGSVEPYFTFGAGYASLGAFDTEKLNSIGIDGSGVNGRLGFGLDVYLTPVFSLGGNLTGDVFFLSRSKVDDSELQGTTGSSVADAQIYAADGSSIGAGATLTLVAGLHF